MESSQLSRHLLLLVPAEVNEPLPETRACRTEICGDACVAACLQGEFSRFDQILVAVPSAVRTLITTDLCAALLLSTVAN